MCLSDETASAARIFLATVRYHEIGFTRDDALRDCTLDLCSHRERGTSPGLNRCTGMRESAGTFAGSSAARIGTISLPTSQPQSRLTTCRGRASALLFFT